MSKKVIVSLLAIISVFILAVGVIRFGWFLPEGGLTGLLASGDSGRLVVFLVVVSALVDSVNPCAFSVLLLSIAFLMSLGKSRRHILATGGVYIFGIFLIYLLIGFGLVQVLQFFGVPRFMSKVGAVIVIIWAAIDLLGAYFPRFPIKLKIPTGSHRSMARLMEKGTIPTAFVLGVLVGLTEFPCTGGPYLFILGLLHDQGSVGQGALYLILYNFLFVLPLLVILFFASDQSLLERVKSWKKANNHGFRITMGVVMLALGFLILAF